MHYPVRSGSRALLQYMCAVFLPRNFSPLFFAHHYLLLIHQRTLHNVRSTCVNTAHVKHTCNCRTRIVEPAKLNYTRDARWIGKRFSPWKAYLRASPRSVPYKYLWIFQFPRISPCVNVAVEYSSSAFYKTILAARETKGPSACL